MDIRSYLDFLKLAERLKCNTRHSYTSSGRRESVAEHSWRLALMAYLVRDEFPQLDIERVIQMCLFHDMGEAVTGDIPAFEKTDAHRTVEADAVETLLGGLPAPYREELGGLFAEMEARETAEARLYKALDKLEAVIQHNEADISTWLPLEYDLQMTYGEQECGFDSYISRLREAVREDSRRKIEEKLHMTEQTILAEQTALTEKEKMGRQMLYDANYDDALIKEREAAKALCHAYNQLEPSETEKQMEIMRRLLGRTKGSFCITAPFWCDYGYNIEVGENFYANHNLVILDGAKVVFGDNVFVAPNCGFHTAGHPIDYERRNRGLEYAYPITVGDNVWIGAGVQVMPGVTIGSNVVIGGGSVVVKDIPDNSVAVGNPCRVIRPITEEDKKTCYDRNPEYKEGTN